jgi:hypothetical protein
MGMNSVIAYLKDIGVESKKKNLTLPLGETLAFGLSRDELL